MANEIRHWDSSGLTFYAVIERDSDGKLWNTAGTPAFENPTAANWANYAVALTEQSTTGVYWANMPAGITAAGLYSAKIFQRIGGSPSLTTDPPGVDEILIDWDGAAALSLNQAFTVAAANIFRSMMASLQSFAVDTATFSATTTVFETTDTTNKDLFTDQGLLWTGGVNKGKTSHVQSYNYSANSKVKLTLQAALPVAPSNGDTFQIVGYIGA